jgi:hypothetical protein
MEDSVTYRDLPRAQPCTALESASMNLIQTVTVLVCLALTAVQGSPGSASANDEVLAAQTVAYCAILDNPKAFEDKMVRVRALYQTDFEQAALTAPACTTPMPLTWVDFERSWESRTP